MYKSLIILFFAAATMFGCGPDQKSEKKPDQSENQTELTDTYWKLVSLQGESVPVHEDQREAHIRLKNDSLKVTGSGGCNVLNGTYKLGDGNSISFSKMATTMMSCPDMETEQQFMKVFETTDSYRVKGDTLLLKNSNKKTLATLVAAAAKEN